MRRRDVLRFLGGAATWPLAAYAQQPGRVYRIAVVVGFYPVSKLSETDAFFGPFFKELRRLGYIEGKNLVVPRFSAEVEPDYAELARKVVRAKPDVIANSMDIRQISQVAKEAYPIPVVALIPSVAAGLVHNIARPEGNITGIALDAGIEMQGKQLDFLRQAVASISRVAFLSNRTDWEGTWGNAILKAGKALGISIIGIPLERSAGEHEYRKAFETMAQHSAEGLVCNGLPPNYANRALIAELASKYRLPSIGWALDVVEKGPGLLCYASDYSEVPVQWADMIDKVLKGAKVADTPVTQPTKFILAINLKTAKSLGLQIPPTLIAQADKVIE